MGSRFNPLTSFYQVEGGEALPNTYVKFCDLEPSMEITTKMMHQVCSEIWRLEPGIALPFSGSQLFAFPSLVAGVNALDLYWAISQCLTCQPGHGHFLDSWSGNTFASMSRVCCSSVLVPPMENDLPIFTDQVVCLGSREICYISVYRLWVIGIHTLQCIA